jgi:AcrR family transcriptional regulator
MPSERHGQRRRRSILAAAADLSTEEGLDGLSFRRLAEEVGLTKAGVAAHFDSKEALQLAAVEAAARTYAEPLLAAAATAEPGLARLRALASAWLRHVDAIEYRGGCFFAAAGLAFAGRPGPVRDAIAEHVRRLVAALEEQARLAARLGELAPDVDPETLAFQIHALAQEANLRRQLLGDERAFVCADRALSDLLERAAARRAQRTAPPERRAARP